MKLLLFVVMLLLVGAFFIISENNLALNNSENVDKFYDLYLDWVGKIVGNSMELAGYVIKLDWLPNDTQA
jgi:hypothetical protein